MSESAIRERAPTAPPDEHREDRPARTPERDAEQDHNSQESNGAPRNGDAKEENEPPEKPKGPPIYKRPLFWIIVAVVLIVSIVVGVLWWLYARAHETTDDAFVQANVVSISPQVAGHVLKRYVDDNQWVKKGDLLVKIDPRDLQAQLTQAEADLSVAVGQVQQARTQVQVYSAQVAQASADVVAAEASSKQAQADLQRYQDVPAAAISQQQLDAARANARTTSANLEAARQRVNAAQSQVAYGQSQVNTAQSQLKRATAAVDFARTQYSYTEITAPIDGEVTNRSVEDGQYVQVGQALLAVVPREVYIIANYKETQLATMRPGQTVEITADAFPHKTYAGHVNSIQAGSGAAFSLLPAENATGNYVKVVQRIPVKITLDQIPQERLAPGMSVEPNVRVR